MTFFEYFCEKMGASLSIRQATIDYYLDGGSGLEEKDALARLGAAEDELAAFVVPENFVRLRESTSDATLEFLRLIFRLTKLEIFSQEQAAISTLAITYASSLTEGFWEQDWDDEDLKIALTPVEDDFLDPPHTSPPDVASPSGTGSACCPSNQTRIAWCP